MSSAAAWRWSLAAGLIAFACSWGFGRIPGLTPCGDTGGLGAILALEFARTPAEVAALFGTEPCRSPLIAAQRTGLWLDALGFIPAYTAFLCLAAWAAGGRLASPVIAALLVAGIADQVEGALLFAILRRLPGDGATLAALFWAVRLKFLLLGLGTLAIAVLLVVHRQRWRWIEWNVVRVVGGLAIGFGAFSALGKLFAMPAPGMMTAFAMAWFTLLLIALLGAVWPLRQPPAPPPPAQGSPSD